MQLSIKIMVERRIFEAFHHKCCSVEKGKNRSFTWVVWNNYDNWNYDESACHDTVLLFLQEWHIGTLSLRTFYFLKIFSPLSPTLVLRDTLESQRIRENEVQHSVVHILMLHLRYFKVRTRWPWLRGHSTCSRWWGVSAWNIVKGQHTQYPQWPLPTNPQLTVNAKFRSVKHLDSVTFKNYNFWLAFSVVL